VLKLCNFEIDVFQVVFERGCFMGIWIRNDYIVFVHMELLTQSKLLGLLSWILNGSYLVFD
jgi:hypothetical protein